MSIPLVPHGILISGRHPRVVQDAAHTVSQTFQTVWKRSINVWRGPDGMIVTAQIPGVKLDAINLTVHQNTLTIKGQREPAPLH